MASINTIARLSSLAAVLAIGSTALKADTTPNPLRMKPLHGISFDVGSERASSYFVAEKGACKLVLTLASDLNWNEPETFTSTRYETTIYAQKTSRFRSQEGKALEFFCEADAAAMSIRGVEEVANGAAH